MILSLLKSDIINWLLEHIAEGEFVMKLFNRFRFGTKITMLTCSFMLIPTLIVAFLTLRVARNELLESSKTTLTRISKDLHKLVSVQHSSLVEKLTGDLNVAHKICQLSGPVTVNHNTKVEFDAVNQVTKQKTSVQLPSFSFGDQMVQRDFTIVDEIQQLVGGTCTIFQRIPGDHFLRVSTNVRKLDGERAVGTYIPSSSPVAKSLLSKKLYTGKAFVVNKDYITAYDPLVDASGEVVGALYVGVPLMNDTLVDNVKEISLAQTGYAYCFNSDGRILIHPLYDGQTKKDAGFVKAILDNPSEEGLVSFKGEDNRENLLAYKYFPEWDWYICTIVEQSEILATIHTIEFFTWTIIVVLITIGGVMSMWFSRKIARAIKQIGSRAEKIANGDLTTEDITLDSEDEIAQLANTFNTLNSSLRAMIQQVMASSLKVSDNVDVISQTSQKMVDGAQALSDNSNNAVAVIDEITNNINEVLKRVTDQTAAISETSASAEQMSKNIQQVSGSIESQASSINESTTAVNQMAASIKQIAENASKVNDIARSTRVKSEQSNRTVKQAVSGIRDIAESSQKIKNIITVITSIASQTNLLALNAAIEAARAGDAGKGFAVVADEVRNLAEQSSQAASEITELIKDANEKAEIGVELIESVNASIDEMIGSIEEVGTLIEEVTNSTGEQQTGAQEIAAAMERLNDITQEILTATNEQAQGAREISKAMQDLSTISEQINNAMEKQSASSAEVNQAFNLVNSVADENRQGVEEFAQCTEDLGNESHALEQIVKQFKL